MHALERAVSYLLKVDALKVGRFLKDKEVKQLNDLAVAVLDECLDHVEGSGVEEDFDDLEFEVGVMRGDEDFKIFGEECPRSPRHYLHFLLVASIPHLEELLHSFLAYFFTHETREDAGLGLHHQVVHQTLEFLVPRRHNKGSPHEPDLFGDLDTGLDVLGQLDKHGHGIGLLVD